MFCLLAFCASFCFATQADNEVIPLYETVSRSESIRKDASFGALLSGLSRLKERQSPSWSLMNDSVLATSAFNAAVRSPKFAHTMVEELGS